MASRDKLSKMTCDEEPDNQLVFDFHKEVVSVVEFANNTSVKDDPYESGFRAGAKHGLKIAQDITKIPGVNEEEK